ncbi:YopX family protein [Ligilactobacillus sp. LYQ139]|uniref:YopX family protein n=1 Tax=Ligilactobacillus sp. LYQ139 TaxID=3378800 RepID=UPI0038546DED
MLVEEMSRECLRFRIYDYGTHKYRKKKLQDITAIFSKDAAEVVLGVMPDFDIEMGTGQKDMHGTLIYDGDIVLKTLEPRNKNNRYLVHWSDKRASFVVAPAVPICCGNNKIQWKFSDKRGCTLENFMIACKRQLEIINNIHDENLIKE